MTLPETMFRCLPAYSIARLAGSFLISLVSSVYPVLAHTMMEQPPAWKADLRQFGYRGSNDVSRSITFGTSAELVVLSDSDFEKPIHVRAFVLDAESGELIHQGAWTVDWAEDVAIYGNADGNYLANTDEGPVLLSRGLKETLKPLPGSAREVAPDGRSFVTWPTGEPGHAVTTFYDALTLERTGTEVVNREIHSIARDRVVETWDVQEKTGMKREIEVFVDGQSLFPYSASCEWLRAQFLSNEMLAIFSCGQLEFVTLSGERVFRTKLHERSVWRGSASRDGSRFATVTDNGRGGAESIQVFDVNERREIYSTIIHQMHGDHDHSGVALSPDSLALVVNTAGIVRYFKLPPKAGG